MKPDRCGFGRDPATLGPGDHEAVQQLVDFLEGRLAYAADRVTLVPADSPAAVYHAPRPGVRP